MNSAENSAKLVEFDEFPCFFPAKQGNRQRQIRFGLPAPPASLRGTFGLDRLEAGGGSPQPRCMPNPYRYFNSSPEVIRLTVMMYIRDPLSLRRVENLLSERDTNIRH